MILGRDSEALSYTRLVDEFFVPKCFPIHRKNVQEIVTQPQPVILWMDSDSQWTITVIGAPDRQTVEVADKQLTKPRVGFESDERTAEMKTSCGRSNSRKRFEDSKWAVAKISRSQRPHRPSRWDVQLRRFEIVSRKPIAAVT